MEFKWLEIFLTMAECGSIRSAAAILGMSPSSLCSNLNALENYLGVKLLDKGPHGSALTKQGQAYIPFARKMLESWSSISDIVRESSEKKAESLNIAFHSASSPAFISRFLEMFIERHPHIVMNLYDDTSFSLSEGINSGNIDIYFLNNPSDSVSYGLQKKKAISSHLCVLVSTKHSLSSRSSVNPEELMGETFILYPETKELSLRNLQLDFLKSAGIRYKTFDGISVPAYYLRYVQLGYGITLIPKALETFLPPKTSLLELAGNKKICDVYMVFNGKNTNHALKMFLDEYETLQAGNQI